MPDVQVESTESKALKRFAKVAAVAVLSAAVAWISGPDAIAVFGTENMVIFGAILIPVLSALEKALVPFTS